jgi:hypothetical protein
MMSLIYFVFLVFFVDKKPYLGLKSIGIALLNRDCPLDENVRKNPFVVNPSALLRRALSNHELPFDKLSANGNLANEQSRLNIV